MHTILLGVVRSLTTELFEPKSKKKTHYIAAADVEKIDNQWLNVKVR